MIPVSLACCGAGFFWAILDPYHRTWHDRLQRDKLAKGMEKLQETGEQVQLMSVELEKKKILAGPRGFYA